MFGYKASALRVQILQESTRSSFWRDRLNRKRHCEFLRVLRHTGSIRLLSTHKCVVFLDGDGIIDESSRALLPSLHLSPATCRCSENDAAPSTYQNTFIAKPRPSLHIHTPRNMQQVNYSSNTTSSASTRTIASEALAYLTPPIDASTFQSLSCKNTTAAIPSHPQTEAAPLTAAPSEHVGVAHANEPCIKAETKTPSQILPSLLQYVDRILMRDKKQHDNPPHPEQKCTSCSIQWDKVSIPSTFLPLSPCGHWIHYRCFIELAIRGGGPQEGRCYACDTSLYEWDGISTLTLATRTDLPMKNDEATAISPSTYALVISDHDEYEQECEVIEKTIDQRFFQHLSKPSGFADNSPDLVQCFNDVLNDLRTMGRPTSKWLTWSTTTGSMLFAMLVAIKMKRFLTEHHGRIRQTRAWIAWEEGCQALQARILEDVHRQ